MTLSHLKRIATCLIVMFVLLALPLAAQAGDVDPNGDKLRALKNDLKFQKAMKAHEGKSKGTRWDGICAAEIATFIGGIIWGERALLDPCDKYHHGDILPYCITHSNYCDHYHWKANCLKDKGCPDLIIPY